LDVGLNFGFGFLSKIKLQFSSVLWTLNTNNFKGSWKSHALGLRSWFTCYIYSSSCASDVRTFTGDLASFFFLGDVVVADFFFARDVVVASVILSGIPYSGQLQQRFSDTPVIFQLLY
jgi:hypothetical protein